MKNQNKKKIIGNVIKLLFITRSVYLQFQFHLKISTILFVEKMFVENKFKNSFKEFLIFYRF